MMHRHGHSAATPDVDAMQAHALAHATSSLGSDVETGYDSEEVGPLLHIDATTHTNEAHHTQHAASGTHSHLHGHHASYDLLPALSSVLTHIGSALTPPGLQAAVREHEHDLLHGSPDCSDNSDGEPDASSTRLYPTTSAVAVTSVSPHRVSPSPPAASCCCGARFPRTRRGITLLALFVVAIALCLDTFVIRRPYGFLVWHELTGVGRSQQPPQTCGWDYEASWKIGTVSGSSPLSFSPTDRTHPALHCGSIPHLPASFVADPFIFIPSNVFGVDSSESAPQLQASSDLAARDPSSSTGTATSTQPIKAWMQSRAQCDMSKAEPVSAANTHQRADAFAGMPGAGPGPDGCYSLGADVARGVTGRDPWYIFYEIKNLALRKGELGASVSFDSGATFQSVGTVLRETVPGTNDILHLSYPQVFPAVDTATGQVEMLMIPETHGVQEVRVYRTDLCCFPFGWSVAAVPLTGAHFVDTSVVFHDGRWYIFTTVEYTLQLYVTTGPDAASLTRGQWTLHPSSPLYTTDRHFGRNAGRIIPFDGGLVRFSQDCATFYGEKVHALRITRLTPDDFAEEWVQTLKPQASTTTNGQAGLLGTSPAGVVHATYLANRIHHVDLTFIPAHEVSGRPVSARWFGVIDGDDIPDDYHFWKQEGWFWRIKAIVALALVAAAVYLLWRNYVLHLYLLRPMKRRADAVLLRVVLLAQLISARLHTVGHTPGSSRRSLCGTIARRICVLLFACAVSLALAALFASFYPCNMYCTASGAISAYDQPKMHSYHQLAAKSQAYTESFAWHAGMEAKLDLTLDAHAADLTPHTTEAEEKAVAFQISFHTPRATAILADASRRQRGHARDAIGRPLVVYPQTTSPRGVWQPAPPPTIWLVVGVDAASFDAALNLLASSHFWWTANDASVPATAPPVHRAQATLTSAPPMVLVYDLGLTPVQRQTLSCVRHARVVRLKYSEYPAHVRLSGSGAWVPFALREVLETRSDEFGVREMDAVVHLSPDIEVRASLAELLETLFERGHFMPQRFGAPPSTKQGTRRADAGVRDTAAQKHDVYSRTNKYMLAEIGVDPRSLVERPLCDAGAIGLVKNKEVDSPASLLLTEAIACASRLQCIFPASSAASAARPEPHAFEHSLFSALYARFGLTCSSEPAYRASTKYLNPDPTLLSFLPASPRVERTDQRAFVGEVHRTVDGVRTVPPPLEGATVTLARGSRAYRSFLPLDQSPTSGTCVPAEDGWTAFPLEAVVEREDWSLATEADDERVTANLWSCLRDQPHSSAGSAAEAKQINAACASQITAYREASRQSRPLPPNTIFTRARTHLAARFSCAYFWIFFLAILPVCLSGAIRAALVRTRWRITGLVLLSIYFAAGVPLYRAALSRWGTFAPWNAMLYTATYEGSARPSASYNAQLIAHAPDLDLEVDAFRAVEPAFAVSRVALALPFPEETKGAVVAGVSVPATPSELFSGPPPGWRPPNRVVVSFTTMPHHVDKLAETIDSLLAQSLLPDAIYLNLPRGRNHRTNQSYEVLPYLIERYANTVFRITRCEDVGPLTKLVPTLEAEPDPQTFVVTVDSDKIYHRDTIAMLVWRSYHDPRAAFGLCGWSFYWQPPPMLVVPVYVPWLVRGNLGRAVDVLQAVCGNVYRRAFFPDLDLLRHPHPKCFTTDDLWIAGYLSTRSHVKRVIINAPGAWSTGWGALEPESASWKAADPEQWQLSSHNTKPGVDMACIRGVEEKLGPWRNIRQMEHDVDHTYDQPEQTSE